MKIGGIENTINESAAAKREYTPVPEGEYLVTPAKFELRQNKAGSGYYVNGQFKIAEGEHAGRVVFNTFVVQSDTSPKGVKVGLDKLNKLCQACGRRGFAALENDTDNLEQLVGRQLIARVKIKPEQTREGVTYKANNYISSFSAN